MNRIVVVCRLNAARSVLIAAALKRRFPQFEFVSCGVEATTGATLPRQTLDTAENWGLELENLCSVNIDNLIPPLEMNDRVIVVDDFIRKDHRLEFINPQNIYSFSDLNLQEIQLPRDPLGFGLVEFKLEIAKGIFFATHIIMELVEPTSTDKNLHLILLPESHENMIESAVNYCRFKKLNLIFVNFMIPNDFIHDPQSVKESFLCFTNSGSFFEKNPMNSSTAKSIVFRSEFEISYAESFIFGMEFSNSINSLSTQKPLLVLCEVFSRIPRIAQVQWLMASQINSSLKRNVLLSEV